MTKTSKFILGFLIVIAIGVGLVFFGQAAEARRVEGLIATGKIATGVIIENRSAVIPALAANPFRARQAWNNKLKSYHVIEFKDKTGTPHRFNDWSEREYKAGKRITVLYDEKDPGNAIIKPRAQRQAANGGKQK